MRALAAIALSACSVADIEILPPTAIEQRACARGLWCNIITAEQVDDCHRCARCFLERNPNLTEYAHELDTVECRDIAIIARRMPHLRACVERGLPCSGVP